MNHDRRRAPWSTRSWNRKAAIAALAMCVAAFGAERPDSFSQRRTRVEQMDSGQREQLWRKYERFHALAPAEQDRLRSLSASIAQQSDAARLQQVVESYQQWLDGLSSAERAELISLEPQQRLERIAELRGEERRRLAPEDVPKFAAWLETRLLRRFPQRRENLRSLSESERREQMRRIIEQNLVRQNQRPGPAAAAQGRLFTSTDFAELRESLSPKAQALMDKAAAPAERKQLFAAWIKQAYMRTPGGAAWRESRISEERLREFYDEDLSHEERVHLLRLPSEQMQRQLRRMYHNRRAEPKDKRRSSAPVKPDADESRPPGANRPRPPAAKNPAASVNR